MAIKKVNKKSLQQISARTAAFQNGTKHQQKRRTNEESKKRMKKTKINNNNKQKTKRGDTKT